LARRVAVAPFRRAVYRLVQRIPSGRVATYGQLAAILGHPRAARAVGTALHWLPRDLLDRVPWQRVINAAGGISYRGDVYRPDLQRRLLEDEGVLFDGDGCVDLQRFRWRGPRREQPVRMNLSEWPEPQEATVGRVSGPSSGAVPGGLPCAGDRRPGGRKERRAGGSRRPRSGDGSTRADRGGRSRH